MAVTRESDRLCCSYPASFFVDTTMARETPANIKSAGNVCFDNLSLLGYNLLDLKNLLPVHERARRGQRPISPLPPASRPAFRASRAVEACANPSCRVRPRSVGHGDFRSYDNFGSLPKTLDRPRRTHQLGSRLSHGEGVDCVQWFSRDIGGRRETLS